MVERLVRVRMGKRVGGGVGEVHGTLSRLRVLNIVLGVQVLKKKGCRPSERLISNKGRKGRVERMGGVKGRGGGKV